MKVDEKVELDVEKLQFSYLNVITHVVPEMLFPRGIEVGLDQCRNDTWQDLEGEIIILLSGK